MPRRKKKQNPHADPLGPPPAAWVWVVVVASLLLRIWMLGEKPAHFDEGVNGWFLDRMFEGFAYNYDPENYHGPLHFYLALPFVSALGANEVALRMLPVLFSVATVWLLTRFHRIVGSVPSLLAAAMFAVSPGALFYGRYGIHEAGLAFFVTLFGLSAMMLWSTGERKWLGWLVLSIAAALSTKETFFMNMLPLPMAMCCVAALSMAIRRPDHGLPARTKGSWSWGHLALVVVASAAAVEVLYRGFGEYDGWGIGKFVDSYAQWAKTADAGAGHKKPEFDILGTPVSYYWAYLMWIYEWPLLIGLAACAPLWPRLGGWGRVLAVWSLGVVLAYSLVPYKTPWCILSMLPVICLAASVPIWLSATAVVGDRAPALALSFAFCLSTLPRAMILNYRDYDSPSEPYVYVQTSREARVLMDELRLAEAQDPRVIDLPAAISLGSYYPLPWWLDRYKRVEYTKDESVPNGAGKAWVLLPWRKKDEFLSKNRSTPWRVAKFKLRDAQEDVAAFMDSRIFPSTGAFVFPPQADPVRAKDQDPS